MRYWCNNPSGFGNYENGCLDADHWEQYNITNHGLFGAFGHWTSLFSWKFGPKLLNLWLKYLTLWSMVGKEMKGGWTWSLILRRIKRSIHLCTKRSWSDAYMQEVSVQKWQICLLFFKSKLFLFLWVWELLQSTRQWKPKIRGGIWIRRFGCHWHKIKRSKRNRQMNKQTTVYCTMHI